MHRPAKRRNSFQGIQGVQSAISVASTTIQAQQQIIPNLGAFHYISLHIHVGNSQCHVYHPPVITIYSWYVEIPIPRD